MFLGAFVPLRRLLLKLFFVHLPIFTPSKTMIAQDHRWYSAVGIGVNADEAFIWYNKHSGTDGGV
jgi:hypothetical protein